MVTTYAHPDSDTHVELEAALYEALDVARGRRGFSRVQRLRDRATQALLDQSMGRLEVGFQPSYQGPLVQEALDKLHRRSFGYAFLNIARGPMEAVEWPLQLLELEETKVAIRVGYYRPNGTNWAHEQVFIMYS